MSFTAWRTARLRRLAHRIIADRKDGVIMLTSNVPGGALMGMGFANTFWDPINRKRRIEFVVDRVAARKNHKRWAKQFARYGDHGQTQVAWHRLAIHNIRHGLPEPAPVKRDE